MSAITKLEGAVLADQPLIYLPLKEDASGSSAGPES
jgi:hypothetical protein